MWHAEICIISGNPLGGGGKPRPHVVVNMANGKDDAMKTNRKTAKRTDERKTAAWLTGRYRNGRRRVEVLGWKKLAGMWNTARPGGPVRRAIAAECRRCGYRPTTILSLNAE